MAATAMNIFFLAPDSSASPLSAENEGALEVMLDPNVGPELSPEVDPEPDVGPEVGPENDGLNGSSSAALLRISECVVTSFAGAVAAADPEGAEGVVFEDPCPANISLGKPFSTGRTGSPFLTISPMAPGLTGAVTAGGASATRSAVPARSVCDAGAAPNAGDSFTCADADADRTSE